MNLTKFFITVFLKWLILQMTGGAWMQSDGTVQTTDF
jgi:hypothetical protein